MTWLFESGHAVDIVLAVIAIELVWLIGRGGWRIADAMLRLCPAVLMMVGLRAALIGLDWFWIALPLAASFPVHLADLARSTRRTRRTVEPIRNSS